MRGSGRFKGFLGLVALACVCIVVKCSYRIVEMAGGWTMPLMQDQTDFIVLDSVYVDSLFLGRQESAMVSRMCALPFWL